MFSLSHEKLNIINSEWVTALSAAAAAAGSTSLTGGLDDLATGLSTIPQMYQCPSCAYSTTRRDKLDKHVMKHVLQDGYHPCGKKRHRPEAPPQRHRHNAEEYHCPYCSYGCTVYKALRKHKKLHLQVSRRKLITIIIIIIIMFFY